MRSLLCLAAILLTAGPAFAQPADYGDYNRTNARVDALVARSVAMEQRVTAIEARAAALDAKLDAIFAAVTAKNTPAPVSPVKPAPVADIKSAPTLRAASGHTHTCANGHTWDHSVTAGHTCPVCGLPQFVQDSTPRAVNVGAAAPYQTAVASFGYSYQLASSGGCANGACAAPQTAARRGLFGLRR